jgi:hypothetical protein
MYNCRVLIGLVKKCNYKYFFNWNDMENAKMLMLLKRKPIFFYNWNDMANAKMLMGMKRKPFFFYNWNDMENVKHTYGSKKKTFFSFIIEMTWQMQKCKKEEV